MFSSSTSLRCILDFKFDFASLALSFSIAVTANTATGCDLVYQNRGDTYGSIVGGAKRVGDYGDARNEVEEEVRVGLSSRKREHRKRRGWCIWEFHRVLGRMPLRYSYGKFVDDIGEHGLCYKGGKIVFYDQS
ncbi:Nucleotide-diphospho-sugar transferase [Vigna unguiculata]|uniref:Nucleotide-diphospho-sugar transferase n=1 Tax=Vigna unguiculata TaxID=3917 RepID=A0A4D6MW82_VIGUN|nr:Nucleotide-diphospho-sugar transferase [Vigna unguiculata]